MMKNQLVLMALILAGGVAMGVYLSDGAESPQPVTEQKNTINSVTTAAVNPEAYDIAELNRLLQGEIKARKKLEQKLESLNRKVVALEDNSSLPINEIAEQPEASQSQDAEDNWFNEQALVDSGMSASQANELKVFFEQQELQRLYLRDQSIREGWDRQQFRDQMQALADEEDALKDRLGEAAFDAYLYASGQSNRVAVSSVLATAPAGEAGIQAGDHILRYDNQRVYSGFELRRATTTGEDNSSVPVEVERDGDIIEFYLPRGPLGIRMNSISKAPEGNS